MIVYEDIAKRTDGDIYVGVVGPVRTGKSTFIKKFMDLLVIPNIENEYKKERATDELPQSASGRTIMTTEPKFVPNEAVEITISNNIKLRTRLVDCVGYLVNNAIGYLEDDMPRMVKTPWSEEEIPFEQAAETDGDIYVGVVGPVRTGKSTFIKKFMDLLVIPNIENEYKKERATDELPQSASGRTIMTTEPKFVPNEAIEITINNNLKLRTRLVDCVGYLVNNAIGYLEDDMPRMVKTPWSEEEIPFEQAAEIGTKKVITEHSTIGIVMTTDGSFTDIPREDYINAEERVITELKTLNKPFVIVLNSENPNSEYTKDLAKKLELKYETTVISINCSDLTLDDINNIFSKVLYEFPINEININFPKWIDILDESHPLRIALLKDLKVSFENVKILKQVENCIESLSSSEVIQKACIDKIELGTGSVCISVNLKENLFYNVLTEMSGVTISNDGDLFRTMSEFSEVKKEYDKISFALEEVKAKGYGIVTPAIDELILDEPEMVKQGSRFGVKLKAIKPLLYI